MSLKSLPYLCTVASRAGKSHLYFGWPCLFFPSLSPLTLLLAHSYLRSVGSRGIYHLGIIKKTEETKDDKEKRQLTCHPGSSLLEPWAALRREEVPLVGGTALPVAQHFQLQTTRAKGILLGRQRFTFRFGWHKN